jgi:hypothetical protein
MSLALKLATQAKEHKRRANEAKPPVASRFYQVQIGRHDYLERYGVRAQPAKVTR